MATPTLLQEAATLVDTSFDELPILDLSLPDAELVGPLREACLVSGFFYVKNHSVSESVVDETFAHAERFFKSLTDEEKMEVHISRSNNFKGYQGLLSENTDPENRGDLHEAFNVGLENASAPPPSSPELDAEGKHALNLWPTQEATKLPNFRQGVLSYYAEMQSLGRRLFPLFALALDLPRDYFDDKTKNLAGIMRLLFYPPQTGAHDDRVLGIGAHTDYEFVTILKQGSDTQALQVLNKQGKWINAPPLPGTFVINLGDALARWTNDLFVSTRHRAINRSGVERYSIPFFLSTDYDAIISPFPTCVSADRPARYEPITAGAYLHQRLSETYNTSVEPEWEKKN